MVDIVVMIMVNCDDHGDSNGGDHGGYRSDDDDCDDQIDSNG